MKQILCKCHGKCECCDKVGSCYDLHHSNLQPKRKAEKFWLKKVLDDAKKSKEQWPDWAKEL